MDVSSEAWATASHIKPPESFKYSKKATQVWVFNLDRGMDLHYKNPPSDDLEKNLLELKEEGKLLDFSIEKVYTRFRVRFEIARVPDAVDDNPLLLEIAHIIDGYFQE